jgi:hypothetical protein
MLDVFEKTAKSYRKSHAIYLKGGQPYWIDLRGDFDTFLRVEDKNHGTVAFNDNAGPGNLNSRLVFTRQKDQLYRLVVSAFQPGMTGHYTLTVKEARQIGKEELMQGELTTTDANLAGKKYFKTYKLNLVPGRSYVLELHGKRVSGVLMLLDPAGKKVLAVNDKAGDFAKHARVDFVPAEAGSYWLNVTSANSAETGTYTLRIRGYEPALTAK